MLNINTLKTIEARGIEDTKDVKETKANKRILTLFLLMVIGIVAKWFWEIGWEYLANPEAGLAFGPPLTIVVRVALSFCAAALTFVPTYNKINQNTSESWVPYLLAFQNGFFWQAALDAIAAQFQ